jgi:hypothetical protein
VPSQSRKTSELLAAWIAQTSDGVLLGTSTSRQTAGFSVESVLIEQLAGGPAINCSSMGLVGG